MSNRWQVTAKVNADDVGPSSAYVGVLDAQTALGVRSAQAGLLDEAEREFRAAPKTDPNNAAAKKLFADLRAKRKRP